MSGSRKASGRGGSRVVSVASVVVVVLVVVDVLVVLGGLAGEDLGKREIMEVAMVLAWIWCGHDRVREICVHAGPALAVDRLEINMVLNVWLSRVESWKGL